jgi:hypothetical protein
MLESLINEDKDGAEELFHEIVVEKSRDIYNNLLEDESEVDESDDEVEEATDEEVDESDEDLDEASDEEVDESDEEVEEGFDLDEFEVEADPMDAMMGGDAGDDMEMDIDMDGGDEEGDDEGDEGDVEDRVEDLEDALDDLKAEFEKMMAGDDEGDDMDDMGDDEGEEEPEEAFAFEATDEEVDESDDTEIEEGGHSDQMIKDKENMSKAEFEKKYGDAAKDMDESAKSASETMREYVEKVSATMGDNGANNTSAVAKPNNMGGTAGNLNQAGSDASSETGAGKKIAGSALNDQNAKDIGTGNVNVPGGKAAKAGKTVPAGHGAEKKGAGETADKAAGSTLNKVSSRAK